ncbi:G2/M phase-specific E3 ubiquitin-protein ligase-like isoform X2 [Melanotaenia boesemani]|uniref:G2/M phase-specific E3 ubiquitin-protein ligase-like isoform X2 n=1 Tax=Melanotaenia boesemani TaxID=1250792 RepID=UPI001C05067A|nr:G2/M phase-specific E3 ubiquitin-protein ligase-like isoform X2 [Melanotaenia boesemani]
MLSYRMMLGEKTVLLAIRENIEMQLLSSEEHCVLIKTKEKKEQNNFDQRCRYIEQPLVTAYVEDPESHIQIQNAEPKTKHTVQEEPQDITHIMDLSDQMEIEMEPSLSKSCLVKWRRLTPQKRGLVVKDVICLPRGHYLAQLERQSVPQSNQQVTLATGLTARITIDYTWSASQMESRLALLFQGQFEKKARQNFSFTYLQCVQSSRALFVPNTPAEGWTGEQVLRISGHGALYILSHHDYLQVESKCSANEPPVLNKKEFCVDSRQLMRQVHPCFCRTPQKLTLNLETILRLFREGNMDVDVETHIQVRREDVLHSALRAVRKPGFCFRSKPVVYFSEDKTNNHQEALGEFFRLTLLELQQSCVFEGRPGSLFLTYNLTALEEMKYYEAGVLIGWSLAQGGPGPYCLHPELYQLMCCQTPSLQDFNWRDIVDAEARIRLQELHGCHDVKQLSPALCEWVLSCGIPGIHSACSNEIPAIYARLVKHYIYHRVASMISQFIEGLNSCGALWDLVKSHWEMFLPVMTSTQQQPLTLKEFKQLFTVCYSHPNSELRAAEEATVINWETVLTLVSDGRTGFSFEDLLVVITGADHLPPLGFHKPISLQFYSQDVNTSDVCLPYASVCSLELFLPRGVTEVVDLLLLLSRALHKALSFTHLTAGDEEENRAEVLT